MPTTSIIGLPAANYEPPVETVLERLIRRVDEISSLVSAMDSIVERACGSAPPPQSKLEPVPNGLLDRLESALDELGNHIENVLERARRIA